MLRIVPLLALMALAMAQNSNLLLTPERMPRLVHPLAYSDQKPELLFTQQQRSIPDSILYQIMFERVMNQKDFADHIAAEIAAGHVRTPGASDKQARVALRDQIFAAITDVNERTAAYQTLETFAQAAIAQSKANGDRLAEAWKQGAPPEQVSKINLDNEAQRAAQVDNLHKAFQSAHPANPALGDQEFALVDQFARSAAGRITVQPVGPGGAK